jgi:hypothetical protein
MAFSSSRKGSVIVEVFVAIFDCYNYLFLVYLEVVIYI